MGMSAEFVAKLKLILEGKEEVARQIKSIKQEVSTIPEMKGITGADIRKALGQVATDAKKTTPIIEQLGMAIRRALIVAPVWMVAREAIKETINFVKDGIQYYLDMEKAILNVRTAIQEMGGAGEATITELTSRFHSLSIETGKTEVGIANIFASVNRILKNTEQSYLATASATKLSEATGVDAAKIAETVAFMYKLQGDSLKGVTTDAQKFQEISELLYTTQAKTPGGLDKLITDLRGFASTMNLADFGIENTIKLFGALESSGVTSGQVLRAGVMKVLTNIGEVSKMLGVDIPKNTAPFDAFTLVLEKLGASMAPGKLNANSFAVIKDIFGTGARGAGQVAALAKDIELLKTSLSGAGVSERDRYLYKKQLEDVTNTAQHQLEVFANLKKQLGETFITGLVGGKDFAESMKNVNNTMIEMSRVLNNIGVEFNLVGKGLNYIFSLGSSPVTDAFNKMAATAKTEADLQERIALGLRGKLTLQETTALIGEVSNSNLITEEGQRKRILDLLQLQANAEAKKGDEISKNNAKMEQSNILAKKQADELENLVLKYAKANPADRGTIRREIELAQMSPESQVAAFQNLSSDRKLLLDMMPRLAESVRAQMTGIIAAEQGLNVGGRFGTQGTPEFPGWSGTGRGGGIATPGQAMISYSPKAADTINIAIAYDVGMKYKEEIAKEVGKQVEDKLLTDETFVDTFAKKISPKI